jgi:hypothetical protein
MKILSLGIELRSWIIADVRLAMMQFFVLEDNRKLYACCHTLENLFKKVLV